MAETKTVVKAQSNTMSTISRAIARWQGQLGHRDQDPRLKSADTDFPEPGENPEHSGEPQEPTKRSLDDVA